MWQGLSKVICGKHRAQCGSLGTANPHPLKAREWISTEDESSLYQLCLIYCSQFHIFILSLCLFWSIYLPVSSLLLSQSPKLVKSWSTLWKKITRYQPQECATLSRWPSQLSLRTPDGESQLGQRAWRGLFPYLFCFPPSIWNYCTSLSNFQFFILIYIFVTTLVISGKKVNLMPVNSTLKWLSLMHIL